MVTAPTHRKVRDVWGTRLPTNLPFGEWTGSGFQSEEGFTGDLFDNADGYVFHTPFRQYTQAQGRWMTPDPAGLAAVDPTNPQTWNLYAYVGNNPTTYNDPLGLASPLNGPNYNRMLDAFAGGGGGAGAFDCEQDGMSQNCGSLNSILQGGGAAQCPDNNCDPQYKMGEWRYYTGYADGSAGFVGMSQAGASAADLAGRPYAVVQLGRYCPTPCSNVTTPQPLYYQDQVVDYFGLGTIGSFWVQEQLQPVVAVGVGDPSPSAPFQVNPGGYFLDVMGPTTGCGPTCDAYAASLQTFILTNQSGSGGVPLAGQIVQEWVIYNGTMTFNQETQVPR